MLSPVIRFPYFELIVGIQQNEKSLGESLMTFINVYC